MKLLYLALSGILLLGTAVSAADLQLQAAIQKEKDGELIEAVWQFDAIARGDDRPSAAQALLHMARCYERLADPKAHKTYLQVIGLYADQKDAAQEASDRLAALPVNLPAHAASGGVTGWYNGDWQSGIPGPANWYRTRQDFSRVYDDFDVPEGGWTIVAVFSINTIDFDGVTEASWQIRSGMTPQSGGKLVAEGLSLATQTVVPWSGRFGIDSSIRYRIQVDRLKVHLAPGKYWLSVAPVVDHNSFASSTLGKNAVGSPPGNNGMAIVDSPARNPRFAVAEQVGVPGQLGIGKDFSAGVLIQERTRPAEK